MVKNIAGQPEQNDEQGQSVAGRVVAASAKDSMLKAATTRSTMILAAMMWAAMRASATVQQWQRHLSSIGHYWQANHGHCWEH